MNPFKYLFLLGAILCGGIGVVAMLIASDGGSAFWSWTSWLIYIPAFILLHYVIEDYGYGPAVTLWAGGTVVIAVIYIFFVGSVWGEVFNNWQYAGLAITVLGLIGLSVSKSTQR